VPNRRVSAPASTAASAQAATTTRVDVGI